MTTAKEGERVGCALSAGDGVLKFLGYGTYVGHKVPDESCSGWMGEALRESGVENPKIVIEGTGAVVWGCECWWGPVAAFDKRFEGFKRELVDIDEVRAEYLKEKSDG